MTDHKPHYQRIAAALLADFPGCMAWLGLADGKKQGDEWLTRNPTRTDNKPGSFAINTKSGAWGDFANDDKGGDLVALAACMLGLPMHEAADAAAARIGIAGMPAANGQKRAPSDANRKPKAMPSPTPDNLQKKAPNAAEDGAVFVSPVPDDVPLPPLTHGRWGYPAAHWEYRDAAGRLIFLHCRFEPPNQKKQFGPLSLWCTGSGRYEWRWKAPGEPRPLLGLPDLAARLDAPVLIVEGEKARDAAEDIAPDCAVMTWAGGAQAVGKFDWSPLAGRVCLLWPDADEPGRACMAKIAGLLHAAGAAAVRLLDLAALARTPNGDTLTPGEPLATGDDAADLIARGWGAVHFSGVLTDAGAWIEAAAPAPEKTQRAPTTERANGSEISSPRFALREDGIYFTERDREGNEKAPRWIATPLDLVARTRTPDTNAAATGWGKLCAFADPDAAEHRVILPDAMLRGDGLEALAMLMDHGLQVSPAGKRLLIEYLQTADPKGRVRVVTRTGWHESRDGSRVFVLPDRAIGEDASAWHFENADPHASPFRQRGKLDAWRTNVGALCVGNSRLIFSVSLAFAAPLVHLVNAESGGCNWRGASSTGKTSMLRVAVSVFGAPDALSRWRSTLNALESLAAIHCDALLALDELKMVDPKEAGSAAYTLCNGQGKARAGREGGLRARLNWRLMLLSSGEISLADHVAEAGQRSHAGQEVRLLDLPADAGAGLGCFENLHGAADGAEFARRLDQGTRKHFGAPFVAYLEKLATIDAATVTELIADLTRRFESAHLSHDASGQARRVASRFALIAAGGELATRWGMTGWGPGDAIETAGRLFREWLTNRGGDAPAEDRQMLRQVRAFLEAHGSGRFTSLARASDDHAPKTLHRAGWSRVTPDTENKPVEEQRTEFFILPEIWRGEICKGFDSATVARLMHARGYLKANNEPDRLPYAKVTIPGEGQRRVFHVLPDFMESDE
jgi:uncharacterized protein (DUF927 family)